MKKNFLFGILFCSAMISKAQHYSAQFGLKGGLNIASLKVINGVDYNSKASVCFGALAHIHMSPHFAVQPEFVFSGQGGKSGNEVLKINYINVPFLLQYMEGKGFRIETGPQFGILIGAKDKNGNVELNIKNNLKSADFSWAFGIGYLFPSSGFGVDVRYNLGISNINDGTTKVQNRVFQAGVFYQFMHSFRK